jgi:LacI family transcriptional regulator
MIGLFFSDHMNSGLKHPFFQDVINSFEQVVGEKDYDLLLFSNNKLASGIGSFDFRARMRGVDGLLLFGISKNDPNLGALLQSQIPCICIDLDLYGPRIGYLMSDNVAGAVMAVDHLVERGHRKIAFFADLYNSKPGLDRMIGYQQALRKYSLEMRADWVKHADFSERGGYEATLSLLELEEIPTAIFCASDTMAIGALDAITDKGLVVGRDVSLIGYDDISYLRFIRPGLSTIRQRREEMGIQAAAALLAIIENPRAHPSIISIQPELVVRESVAYVSL